jgi:hypothetical protein
MTQASALAYDFLVGDAALVSAKAAVEAADQALEAARAALKDAKAGVDAARAERDKSSDAFDGFLASVEANVSKARLKEAAISSASVTLELEGGKTTARTPRKPTVEADPNAPPKSGRGRPRKNATTEGTPAVATNDGAAGENTNQTPPTGEPAPATTLEPAADQSPAPSMDDISTPLPPTSAPVVVIPAPTPEKAQEKAPVVPAKGDAEKALESMFT